MGFFGGLWGDSSSSSSSTSNVETFNFANNNTGAAGAGSTGPGGDSNPTNYNIANTSGLTLTATDHGAIKQSFEFGTHALDRSYDALDKSTSAYNDTRDALRNAYQQSLSFVHQQTEPEAEKTRAQQANLTYAVLAVVALVAFFSLSKTR